VQAAEILLGHRPGGGFMRGGIAAALPALNRRPQSFVEAHGPCFTTSSLRLPETAAG
jgi:hypothetical protein